MDNFREWLSDNLRYILLGAGVLVMILVVFFVVRAMAGAGKSKPTPSGNQVSSAESGNQQTSGNQGEQAPGGSLEKDAVPEVSELVRDYYKALGEKNIKDLKSVVKDLDPAEESKIANTKYIESYENVEVYTEEGMEEGTYVVFASFAYKCVDVETAAPALSQLYVITDEDGKLWISAEAVSDPEIQAYVSTIMSQPDVIQLRNSVQASYDQAQAKDPQLKAFLESLGGEDAGTPTPQSEEIPENNETGQDINSSDQTPVSTAGMLTALDDCNVRIAAQSGTDVIGVVPAGEQVNKLGEENGWVQIEYGGIVGYVYQDLLQ